MSPTQPTPHDHALPVETLDEKAARLLGAEPPTAEPLRAVLTVTIKTRPDGTYYADHNDLIQNATDWIEGGLEDRDDISEVTITPEMSAASGVQPDTRPEPCGPAPSECDAEAGEPCANHEREAAHAEGEHAFCGTECAAPARPVPDTERRDRWADALNDSHDSQTSSMYTLADAALAVADEEQRDLRAELADVRRDADYFRGWAEGNGKRLNTALAENAHLRRGHKAAVKEIADLRAELEQARATTLVEAAEAVAAERRRREAPGINRVNPMRAAGMVLAEDVLRRMAAAQFGGQAEDEAQPDDDVHVCKPGATVYYCPTSGETESDCHGGFDVCCARPGLHAPADEDGAQQK